MELKRELYIDKLGIDEEVIIFVLNGCTDLHYISVTFDGQSIAYSGAYPHMSGDIKDEDGYFADDFLLTHDIHPISTFSMNEISKLITPEDIKVAIDNTRTFFEIEKDSFIPNDGWNTSIYNSEMAEFCKMASGNRTYKYVRDTIIFYRSGLKKLLRKLEKFNSDLKED